MHLPGIAGEKTDAEGTDLIYEGITTGLSRRIPGFLLKELT
jgi:hypothetical protein